MNKPTELQIKILLLTTKRPFGRGLSQEKAGKILGMHRDTLRKHLNAYKLSFPDSWEQIQAMTDKSEIQRIHLYDKKIKKALNHPFPEYSIELYEIKERF